MTEKRFGASIDRFAPILEGILRDMNAGAKAGAPGCVLVLVTLVGGAIALAYAFTWNSGWETDPVVLASLAGYVAAVWLVWKAGARWAAPEATVALGATQRLETEVLQPLIADMRRGARYTASTTAPADTLERSRLAQDRPFKSANQICWRAGDLELEMFEVDALETSSDSPGYDRHFLGMLAWTDVPEVGDDLYVVIRSRHEFANSLPIRGESSTLDGFAVDPDYRVISNFAPFAQAICTARLQDSLRQLAAEGRYVHVAVANRAVWVGIEVPSDAWFRRYPQWTFTLLRVLDNAHAADLERQLDIVETLATEAARAVRAYEPPSGRP